MKDFTPTRETISLHGLGFIQVILGGDQRLHVWHPELPRRECYNYSAIHNHRFSFVSRVLVGRHFNVRVDVELARNGSGTHNVISHNGPRGDKGGRQSYPVADCNVYEQPAESYGPGEEYSMPMHQYHYTPNVGTVVTLMRKIEQSQIHASSVILKGVEFDYAFDRFQLSPKQLFDYVIDALDGASA